MGKNNVSVIPSENLTFKAILVLLLLTCIWGGNAVAMKIALGYMPPFILAGLRFAFAAFIIFLWGILNKIDLKPRREDIPYLIILSLLFAAQIGTFNLGTKFTTAGRSSLFVNTHPFFVAVIAHFFIPSDKLNVRKILGLLLAFVGVLVVFRDKVGVDSSWITGDVIILASGLLLAVLSVYTKRLVQNINAYKLLLWEMLFGLVPFFGMSLIFERSELYVFSPKLVVALLYQGAVVGGFGFVAWTLLLKRYSASKVSAFMFATPLFGVALGGLILRESVTPYLVIGVVLVAAGIYIVNKSGPGIKVCS